MLLLEFHGRRFSGHWMCEQSQTPSAIMPFTLHPAETRTAWDAYNGNQGEEVLQLVNQDQEES